MDTKLLKQKILDLAIRGKLVPQDPNDEPASILLEKIKKEKQELIKQGKIKKDKNESTIYVGDDKQHYEKFADGTVKNIENEIPFDIPETWFWSNGYGVFYPMRHIKPCGDFFQYIDIDSVNNKTHNIDNIKILKTNKAPSRASRYIESGDTVFSMVRPYLENIAFVDDRFTNAVASTGFFICHSNMDKKYIYYLMISKYSINGLNFYMKGDNSPSINSDNVYKFLFPIPPLAEQERIVQKIEELFAQVDKIEEEKQSLLKLIDRAKEKVLDLAMKGKLVKQDPNDEPASVLLEKIFEEKKKLAKEGKIKLSKDELLPPQISDDNDYYEKLGYNPDINWLKLQIRDVLYYEQPTKYIVENTTYKNEYKTPVLTAGKSFILGYTNEVKGIYNKLPCIIFDDFTTESKFVDFPFKVKSSAMKILSNNTNVNIKFIYYLMQQIKVNFDTHKRYWISDFSKKEIIIPSLNIQNKLIDCVESFIKYFDNIKADL